MTPRLPKEWNKMALRKIYAFENDFDVEVERSGREKLKITVIKNGQSSSYTIKEGATQKIQL
jgi:hypothetical protein